MTKNGVAKASVKVGGSQIRCETVVTIKQYEY